MSVKISKYKSNIYALKVKQNIDRPIEDIWNFFATPKNLNELTPKDMKFEILSGKSDRFFEGKIISYTVNPFKFFNIKWVTEITHITKNKLFIDEQRFGPYSFWHHKHFIKEIKGGVLMEDVIHYKLPLGPLGKLLNSLFINSKLNSIFKYRQLELIKIFGDYK